MFDKFTMFALINWSKLDGEMLKKLSKKMISDDDYEKFLSNRRLVIHLLNRGDSDLTKENLSDLDDFMFEVYSWGLQKS